MLAHLLSVVVISITGWPATAAATGPAIQVSGSYQFFVCEGKCSPEDAGEVGHKGILVLNDEPIDPTTLPVPMQHHLTLDYRNKQLAGPPNGCFALRSSDGDPSMKSMGFIHWELEPPDSIRFLLYSSPDAEYEIVAQLDQRRLTGTATAHGAHLPMERIREDWVWGEWMGDADLQLCVEAVEALEADWFISPCGYAEIPDVGKGGGTICLALCESVGGRRSCGAERDSPESQLQDVPPELRDDWEAPMTDVEMVVLRTVGEPPAINELAERIRELSKWEVNVSRDLGSARLARIRWEGTWQQFLRRTLTLNDGRTIRLVVDEVHHQIQFNLGEPDHRE